MGIAEVHRWLFQLEFRRAIWLAPVALMVHEAEELNIHAWYIENFVDPGYFSEFMNQRTVIIGLIFISAQGVVWTALTSWPRNSKVAAFVTLPLFVFFSGHALAHIYWVFYFRTYAPGVVTASFVLIPVVVFLCVRAVRERLVPWWYLAAFCVPVIMTVADTVRAGNHVTATVQNTHMNVARIVQWLFGGGT